MFSFLEANFQPRLKRKKEIVDFIQTRLQALKHYNPRSNCKCSLKLCKICSRAKKFTFIKPLTKKITIGGCPMNCKTSENCYCSPY